MEAVHSINFRWLVRLRWGIILGQLVVIFGVAFFLSVSLPLLPLLSVLAFEVLSNVAAHLWLSRRTHISEWMAAAVMGIDVLTLTLLLSLTGGPFNPFTSLYLVYIALAAVVLRSVWTWILVGLALSSFATLFYVQNPFGTSGHMHSHLQGMWAAFGIAAFFIVYFVQRVRAELVIERERSERSERLASLATLSAGAAHELATPLSTIAVIAKELEHKGAYPGDVRLIRTEVTRCREILNQLALGSGETGGEPFIRVPWKAFVDSLLSEFPDSARLSLEISSGGNRGTLQIPPMAITRAFHGIFKNAIQASRGDQPVKVQVQPNASSLRIRVTDQGVGISPEILARVGEPFFTTKEPGQGMGLGVFLARTVIERMGGGFLIESKPGTGTVVTITLPMESVVGHANGIR